MGKALALAGSVGGGGAVAVGGYYLVSGALKSSGTEDEKAKTEEVSLLEPDTLEKFKGVKGENSKDKCIKEIFDTTTIDFTSTADNSTTLPNENEFFKTPSEGNTKGCLTINYAKKKVGGSENNKLTGIFTWTWIFVNNDKGFINFNIAIPEETNKLKLSGGFYLIEKTPSDASGAWKIRWKDEVTTSGKEVDFTGQDIKFPKKKESSKVSIGEGDYWGFVESTGAIKEISASGGETSSEKWTWKWTSTAETDSVGVGEWSDNLKAWWENLYESSKSFDLASKLSTFKGKWEQATSNQ